LRHQRSNPVTLDCEKQTPLRCLFHNLNLHCIKRSVVACIVSTRRLHTKYKYNANTIQKHVERAYFLPAVVQFAHEHEVAVEEFHLLLQLQLSLLVGPPHAVCKIPAEKAAKCMPAHTRIGTNVRLIVLSIISNFNDHCREMGLVVI